MRYIRSIDWLASIRGVSGHGMTSEFDRAFVLGIIVGWGLKSWVVPYFKSLFAR